MVDLDEWTAWRAKEDERLYEQYGEPLEAAHKGEYVAIGPDGQTIVGPDDIEVLRRAIERFGSGRFAFRQVGEPAVERWLHRRA